MDSWLGLSFLAARAKRERRCPTLRREWCSRVLWADGGLGFHPWHLEWGSPAACPSLQSLPSRNQVKAWAGVWGPGLQS